MTSDTSHVRDALIGVWIFDSAGMRAEVVFQQDGTYSDALIGGAQGHSGTWAVVPNGAGGYSVVLTLKDAFPKETIGPLGSTPIVWPPFETWNITNVQPNRIDVFGGVLNRMQPGMAAPGPSSFPGSFAAPDLDAQLNAEAAKEMQQVADAGRAIFGKLKQMFSGSKKG